jgi:hypothetical protein
MTHNQSTNNPKTLIMSGNPPYYYVIKGTPWILLPYSMYVDQGSCRIPTRCHLIGTAWRVWVKRKKPLRTSRPTKGFCGVQPEEEVEVDRFQNVKSSPADAAPTVATCRRRALELLAPRPDLAQRGGLIHIIPTGCQALLNFLLSTSPIHK